MKKRLDVLLVEKGLVTSREKAKAVIMAGIVYVNNEKEDKAGSTFHEDVNIEVRGKTLKYVSRGGLKLEKAMQTFPIQLDGTVCMDVGSSTGGFTDCMLQSGAVKVYSVDVGHGQLDWKLRNDERVVVMEKTNIRYVEPEHIQELCDFASVDVSFISLSKVLPPLFNLMTETGECVCLIKPQFEAGREKVGKHGVVRDHKVHAEVIEACLNYAREAGFKPLGLTFSPVKGPEGNIEYLMYITKNQSKEILCGNEFAPDEKSVDEIDNPGLAEKIATEHAKALAAAEAAGKVLTHDIYKIDEHTFDVARLVEASHHILDK